MGICRKRSAWATAPMVFSLTLHASCEESAKSPDSSTATSTATDSGAGSGGGADTATGGTSPTTPAPAPTPTPAPAPTPAPVPANGAWIAGYYVGYQKHLYPPSAVDFASLTHLIVGRVVPNNDGSLNMTMDLDATTGPALAKELAGLTHAAGKKAILFLGGAGARDAWVSAASDANRPRLVANLLTAMTELGYDGLDIDWEPIQEADYANLLALVRELRAARPGMLLSVPTGWMNTNFVTVPSFYASLAESVDRLNVMSYEMAGAYEGWLSWHSAPLHGATSRTPASIASTVAAYVSAGVPKAKIGVGAGFYGSCWRGVTEPGKEIGSATVVAGDNMMSYTNIMAGYYNAASYRYDSTAQAPYLSSTTGLGQHGCTFLSYEDETSMRAKGAYIRAEGLGGVIMWTINQGYIPSNTGNTNPLARALSESIGGR